MRIIFTSLLTIFFSCNLYSTAQTPDKIIYLGKEYKLHSNPLEEFFADHPKRKPESEVFSTGLWRGYRATFQIENKELYLVDPYQLCKQLFINNKILKNAIEASSYSAGKVVF